MLLQFLPGLRFFLLPILYFVVWIGYGILFEWFWRGQTPGKRLFRLRVMDVNGLRLQFHQILMRNLLRAVDSLPACYLVGGLACLDRLPQEDALGLAWHPHNTCGASNRRLHV